MSLKLLAIDLRARRSLPLSRNRQRRGGPSRKVSWPKRARDDQGPRSGNRRHGGLRQRAFLGPPLSGRWPSSFADQSSICEAVRVKGSKNDAADAEGIFEAALRPAMRFVPVKSPEQQGLQSLRRARERVVCARTALINHMRGLLGEYGVILPQGAWRFLAQAQDAIAGAELSDLTRELFADMQWRRIVSCNAGRGQAGEGHRGRSKALRCRAPSWSLK